MPPQHRLDLAQLHAEPAHLHLVIEAPQVLEGAIRKLARQIARSVEPPAAGVGDEPLGRQRRAAPVTAGDADAAEAELAGLAGGQAAPGGVEHGDMAAFEGATDGHPPIATLPGVDGGVDRRLRRAVGVEEAAPLAPARRQVGRARLAGADDRRERRQIGSPAAPTAPTAGTTRA